MRLAQVTLPCEELTGLGSDVIMIFKDKNEITHSKEFKAQPILRISALME